MKSLEIKQDQLVFNENTMDIMFLEEDDLAQCIERALTTRLGEWFLNFRHGLDELRLRRKNVGVEEVKIIVSDCIFQDPRVLRLNRLDVKIDNETRSVKVEFETDQVSGEVTI